MAEFSPDNLKAWSWLSATPNEYKAQRCKRIWLMGLSMYYHDNRSPLLAAAVRHVNRTTAPLYQGFEWHDYNQQKHDLAMYDYNMRQRRK